MESITTRAGVMERSELNTWIDAQELNQLLNDPILPVDFYWTVTEIFGWEKLESAAQIADVINMVTKPGETFQVEPEEPIDRYSQGLMFDDGTFMLELAVVDGDAAYNMRVGYGTDLDKLSSHPRPDEIPDAQDLNRAQVIEVLTSWVQGIGLPAGYGGTIHVYS